MPGTFNNIILRMPNWLGDAVMATPTIADVRAQWPHAHITALCQGGVASLLAANPHLNEILSFSRPKHLLDRSLVKQLHKKEYDLGILLPNSLSSAWWFWRGGVKHRIGFAANGRSPLLTLAPPMPPERGKEHLVTTYKRLLTPLGIHLSETSPQLFTTLSEKHEGEALLLRHNIPPNATLIGINPGAAYGSAKCWLPDRFRTLIEHLVKRNNTYILCFGDQMGASLVETICRGMPSNVINLAAATNLRELMALIEKCSVLLTNDSGPMHIAAALKTPLVALFGSTNEIATGPYQWGSIIHKHVPCSPCYKRVCPIDFPCMKKIEVNEVYETLIDFLKN